MLDAPALPVTIDFARCTGCGRCLDSCPADVFGFDAATRKATLAYPRDCCVCLLCIDDCPVGAIHVEHVISGERKHSAYESLPADCLVLDPSRIG